MRIALDARTVYRPVRRGTAKNLIDLYRHLALLRPEWRVTAYHRQPGAVEPLLSEPFAEERRIDMLGDRFDAWERWRLPMAAWREGADVLHCPANTSPAWMPVDTVVTIHDLIPLDMPDDRPAEEVRRFGQAIRRACDTAAWIVCPSLYTRNRLAQAFDADPKRITVNPWPADSAMRQVPADEWEPVLARYGVRPPFVIHFGASDARKNTLRVLESWARLPKGVRKEWRLLIVGLDGRMRNEVAALAALRGVAESVAPHGFAAEQDLPTLLSAADVLAFPSLSEGYGLPILDAWVAGAAVLTSNCTSLPEVADDAAVLVDPADTDAIAEGLLQLMDDPALCSRLVELGRERLLRYTWHGAAERFALTLERACGVRGQVRRAA